MRKLVVTLACLVGCSKPVPGSTELLLGKTPAPIATRRSWACSAAGTLPGGRSNFTVTALRDGQALVVGGDVLATQGGMRDVTQVDRFDATTRSFVPAPPLRFPRSSHAAARLADGRVLVVGGTAAEVELFDPETSKWTTRGRLDKDTLAAPFVVLLPRGDALVTGGDFFWRGARSDLAYRFDAHANKLRRLAPAPRPLAAGKAYPDVDGTWLLWPEPRSREDGLPLVRFDPHSDTFSNGPTSDPRKQHAELLEALDPVFVTPTLAVGSNILEWRDETQRWREDASIADFMSEAWSATALDERTLLLLGPKPDDSETLQGALCTRSDGA